jgi:hypothetical protein
MISHEYKCINIHIPKTAGTSISWAFSHDHQKNFDTTQGFDKKNKIWIQHATAQEVKKLYTNEEQWNNYFKFAIVRNPFDKIVSSYNWLSLVLRPRIKVSNFTDRLMFEDFIYKKGRFKKFLDPTLDTKEESRHTHLKTSTYFIMDENDNLMVDYVGRFENLKNEWEFICDKLGIVMKLHHINKHSRSNKHYRDYYNDKTKAYVSEIYKKDLKIFGYEF